MYKSTAMFLCLTALLATAAIAQEDTSSTEDVMEDVADGADAMADTMSDEADAMADTVAEDADVMADAVAETADAMEDTVSDAIEETVDAVEETATEAVETVEDTSDAAPSLEEIAASDPNLSVTTDESGEVDAMVMLSDVLFGFGDASLSDEALATLRGVADKLDGVASIEITGHTDAIGDEDFNLALGQRRADAVRDWLVANTDLSADVVSARGVGEADPIAPNTTPEGADDPEGRAQNRRVEFSLPDEG